MVSKACLDHCTWFHSLSSIFLVAVRTYLQEGGELEVLADIFRNWLAISCPPQKKRNEDCVGHMCVCRSLQCFQPVSVPGVLEQLLYNQYADLRGSLYFWLNKQSVSNVLWEDGVFLLLRDHQRWTGCWWARLSQDEGGTVLGCGWCLASDGCRVYRRGSLGSPKTSVGQAKPLASLPPAHLASLCLALSPGIPNSLFIYVPSLP